MLQAREEYFYFTSNAQNPPANHKQYIVNKSCKESACIKIWKYGTFESNEAHPISH